MSFKLKVLPNPYQTSVKLWQWKNKRRVKDGLEPVEFDLVKYYPVHKVVYNREGFYLTPDDCWLEFDMGDGVIKAISYDRERFYWELKEFNDKEALLNRSDWLHIERLLRKGLIPLDEYFAAQQSSQDMKQMEISFGRQSLAAKKRIRQKIKEKQEV